MVLNSTAAVYEQAQRFIYFKQYYGENHLKIILRNKKTTFQYLMVHYLLFSHQFDCKMLKQMQKVPKDK